MHCIHIFLFKNLSDIDLINKKIKYSLFFIIINLGTLLHLTLLNKLCGMAEEHSYMHLINNAYKQNIKLLSLLY